LRLVKTLTCLALLGAGLTALTTTGSAGAKPDDGNGRDRPALLRELRADADGSVTITGESATRKLGFIRAGRNGDLMPSSDARAVGKADAFLDKYAPLLGAPSDQLVRESVSRDRYGSTVAYTQRYQGVPVFGAMVLAHLDKGGALTSVNGVSVPNLDLSVDPAFSKAEAGRAAVRTVRADPPGHDGEAADTSGIRAVKPRLVVYREGLVRGDPGASELVWQVEVTNRANIRDMVFISATTGKPVNRYSLIHDALHRIVYEQEHDPAAIVWEEGDPFPGTLNEDQQNIVLGSGESYWFFSNAFGRDSYDGAGAAMETVNNDPRINCPNANWNGVTTNYCNGVTSDDVVAHEWGHAYTEYTHNLIYQWQPGALNESYSDIWGETVDLINGRMDEDEGDITAKRADGLCATEGPRAVQLVINSPADIAKVCLAGAASWGAVPDTTGITNDIVLAEDPANEAGPLTTDGCSPLTNAAEMDGHIGLVYRGTCPFTQKAQNLVDAGAIAVVIGNNNGGGPFAPGGALDPPLTVPVIGISQDDADRVAGGLESGAVNGTVRLSGTAETVDSFRWLMGEDSTAFGGAIRDMWVPTCAGDPGKVSDAEYHCSTEDGGGVHSNSGVPNHGYALLVDGGDYNGVTVPAIGMTKAAAIYFRAMTEYQTPTTEFTDHADALEASCADLVGQPINELSTAEDDSAVSDEVIAAEDCVAVAAMAEAVELRTEPVQCNFQPLLDPDTPVLCASGKPKTFYRESFSDRLNGWTRSNTAVFDPAGAINWESSSALPGGRAGKAAYGPGPDIGNCSGGAGDVSGVSRLTSPLIRTPSGSGVLAMSFMHYVATEAGFDGGNLKISLNNGPFEQVPLDAFLFNDYNTTLVTEAGGNTNPLAGQPAFSGTDGGEVTGSWGQTQIDLSMIGANPGDRLRLRFDFGRDGCGGNDGWYVDDIRVSTCKATSGVAADGAKGVRNDR
jgi:Zn-dependent metalloprotease